VRLATQATDKEAVDPHAPDPEAAKKRWSICYSTPMASTAMGGALKTAA
jgi:hypothetical protein